MESSRKTRFNFIKFIKEPNPNLSSPILTKNHNPTFILLLFFHHMSCSLERNGQEEGLQSNNGLLLLENLWKRRNSCAGAPPGSHRIELSVGICCILFCFGEFYTSNFSGKLSSNYVKSGRPDLGFLMIG